MTTTAAAKKITKTTAKRAPRVSAEERQAQAAALHESIAVQVEQLRNSGAWTRFLKFTSSFHRYSFGNLMLILAQCPDAQYVAGFRAWQAKGRQVRKGEKAIRIFGFAQRTLTPEDTGEAEGEGEQATDEAGRKVVRFYPMVSVFDIGQTDLIDGAEDASTLARRLTGTEDHGVIATLTAHLEAEGWTVERRPLRGLMNGYTDPAARTVVLAEGLEPMQEAKTLLHELAHIVLEHVADLEEYAQHRGLMETEAESVAYVVAGIVGFDTAAYSVGYIAGWSNADTAIIKATASRVLAAAHHIAEILDPTDTDQEPTVGS
jgi:hypothetical protein